MKKLKTLAFRFFSSKIAVVMLLGISSVAIAHGADKLPQVVDDQASLQALLCSIVNWFFWIVIVISVIMILFAAFTYVTAGDNTEKTTKARKTITYAAIGIVVAFMAGAFPKLIASIFPANPDVPVSC